MKILDMHWIVHKMLMEFFLSIIIVTLGAKLAVFPYSSSSPKFTIGKKSNNIWWLISSHNIVKLL